MPSLEGYYFNVTKQTEQNNNLNLLKAENLHKTRDVKELFNNSAKLEITKKFETIFQSSSDIGTLLVFY